MDTNELQSAEEDMVVKALHGIDEEIFKGDEGTKEKPRYSEVEVSDLYTKVYHSAVPNRWWRSWERANPDKKQQMWDYLKSQIKSKKKTSSPGMMEAEGDVNPDRFKKWKAQVKRLYPRAVFAQDHTGRWYAKASGAVNDLKVGEYGRSIAPRIIDKETYLDLRKNKSTTVTENAEQLDAGDDVVITGRNNVYQGKTGYIVDFGQDKRFVIVQLHNHGRHSFHSSDVSRNEYADSEEEHDEWNDIKEAGETRHVLYLNGKAVSHYATPNEARQQAALVLKKFPNTQVDIRSAQTGLAEERVRLDARCWRGKKIGNPKTKLKGGVRVNNCVPK